MSKNSTHSLDASHRIQEKYDFYFLALTFTILGFTLQTKPDNLLLLSEVAELLSWLFLLTSGICGMFRIEKRYQLFATHYYKTEKGKEVKLLKEAQIKEIEYVQASSGKAILPVNDKVITGLRKKIAELNKRLEKDNLHSKMLFYLQKYLFLTGLLTMMISRGLKPFLKIISG